MTSFLFTNQHHTSIYKRKQETMGSINSIDIDEKYPVTLLRKMGLTKSKAQRKVLTGIMDLSGYITTEEYVIELIKTCPSISQLKLAGCPGITDKVITTLAEYCPQLLALDLEWCDTITDSAIISLSQNCRKLCRIKLDYCSLITEQSISSLASNCPHLIIRGLEGTGITLIEPSSGLNYTNHIGSLKGWDHGMMYQMCK